LNNKIKQQKAIDHPIPFLPGIKEADEQNDKRCGNKEPHYPSIFPRFIKKIHTDGHAQRQKKNKMPGPFT
jgi:hypothetical protein